MLRLKNIKFLTILLLNFLSSTAEYYTSIDHMQDLLISESKLVEILRPYLSKRNIANIKLNQDINDLISKHNDAISYGLEYVNNPVNAYLLTKRLTGDWSKILQQVSTLFGDGFLKNITSRPETFRFPSNEDLAGAATALIRLQETYDLNAASIANGIINGIFYGSKMSVSDCFELSVQSFLNRNFHYAGIWMRQTFEQLRQEAKSIHVELQEEIQSFLLQIAYEEGAEIDQKSVLMKSYLNQLRSSERLCRKNSSSKLSKLHCRYVSNNIGYFMIGPLKLEEVSLDPFIVVYHNVLYDKEIEHLKTCSRRTLERALTWASSSSLHDMDQIRTSKVKWLDSNDTIMRNIDIRIELITGLTTVTAEKWQIINYGIGGHYVPHLDEGSTPDHGERIATMMFYLSNVNEGGATIFPLINATIWPKKGSGLFWYNVHTSGGMNFQTVHGGCPVLIGNKWIANKWMHEIGQEFRRPCQLKQVIDNNDYSMYNTIKI